MTCSMVSGQKTGQMATDTKESTERGRKTEKEIIFGTMEVTSKGIGLKMK